MPFITLIDFAPAFPVTDAEKKMFAQRRLRLLAERWVDSGPPNPPVFHVLLHHPAEIAPNSDWTRVTALGDDAAVREDATGLVAVALTLTDTLTGAEPYEVWRITSSRIVNDSPD